MSALLPFSWEWISQPQVHVAKLSSGARAGEAFAGEAFASEAKYRKSVEDLLHDLRESFVSKRRQVDWDKLEKRAFGRPIRSKPEFYAVVNWLLSSLGDPYSCFLPPAEYQAFRSAIAGTEVGIGASVRPQPTTWPLLSLLAMRKSERVYELVDVVPKGPAAEAGMCNGDVLRAVDNIPVEKMSPRQVNEALQGPVQSEVRLLVEKSGRTSSLDVARQGGRRAAWLNHLQRILGAEVQVTPGRRMSVILRRSELQCDSVTWDLVEVSSRKHQPSRAGYIEIREWTKTTFRETVDAVRKLTESPAKALDNIIVDLRDNSGGVFTEALDVAQLFVGDRDAALIDVTDQDSSNNELTSSRSNLLRLFDRSWHRIREAAGKTQLIVLVNGRTASASELVAAALRRHCRAVLVGTKTYGKTSIQAVMNLDDQAGYKITVATFDVPNGDLSFGGMEPDVEVERLPRGGAAVSALLPRYEARIARTLSRCKDSLGGAVDGGLDR